MEEVVFPDNREVVMRCPNCKSPMISTGFDLSTDATIKETWRCTGTFCAATVEVRIDNTAPSWSAPFWYVEV